MSSMNSRFKGLGFGSKRKSGSNAPTIAQNPGGGPNSSSAPQIRPISASATSSSSSLPMNHSGAGGRPPSYTNNTYPPAPTGINGARTTSPMAQHPRTPPSQVMGGPPPINTASTGNYPPPGHPAGMGAPQQAAGPPGYGPPQYGAQFPPGANSMAAAQYANRNNAVEVEGAGRSKAQLIVGIDFGTTFSGVAFAFATNTEAKEDIITEWPGAGSYTKQKIPTVLYYDQYQKVVGWGPDIADALAPTGYPKPGVQKVEWFKLQLMLSGNTYIDPINLPPLPPGKSEIDVAADYLFKLRQAMRIQLQKTLGEVFNREERNIRYYLTVPAIWNDAGKAATRAAAIQAGFLRDENDNRLTLITEPEAAALFCSKAGLLNLKVHDAVLIVDCGGGTVDLIAYEVEEESPFTVSECTAGSGDSCGSTALNRNFSNILRTKIRKMKLPDGSKTAGRVYAKCIMDFENRIKADFRNNNQKWAVDVGIEAEFPEAGIEEGYMTFTNEEILQCFEPVVNRILELVRNQIIAIQAQNRTLQNVLVVGGFGASEYLFQQIKLHVPPQFQAKVVRPMDSVAAIVKGAVTAGITERVVTSRVARRHYLMATLQPFKEGHHPEAYRVPSLDGKDRCKFTRQIFVQKGQRVKIGEPVKVSFFRQVAPGATLMYEDILYACDDDVCPEYTKDPRVKEVVTLTSDLSRKNLEKDFERMDTPQGTFYRVYFDIYLTLDGSEFNAELVCQGEVMGRCTSRFNLPLQPQCDIDGRGDWRGMFEMCCWHRMQLVQREQEGKAWVRWKGDGVKGYGPGAVTHMCRSLWVLYFRGIMRVAAMSANVPP
ncbi:Hsp70-like protein [Drepanopeziza brunnea f. sp. 'multigermtubi' MB_m1]|uniref:Hsp70-like protein n=1 Tax=Marssonina brunnea f. sp. multigermtubi (strain MB_m1) TaxID=1072389 RepID=K1WJB0_MARBU|nr:Hsp70-like protein [Drepanopeziza brunnea f. sp. 'multigermtubi' MB_m1]EKD12292.1 Hsp70-like protein [Drepanopeziza brunnea f. sp. 'multigermtubi' MB_m1]